MLVPRWGLRVWGFAFQATDSVKFRLSRVQETSTATAGSLRGLELNPQP